MRKPYTHRNATLAIALCALAGNPVLAQPQGPQAQELQELTVIGSRSAARAALDASVPIEVYDAQALLASGAAGNELGEVLAALSPGFTFPRQSNSVTSDHVRAAQLRGMSPDQVLVLVNGKRRHVSAVVNDNTKIGRGTNAFDFNSIPLSSVRRIEILRDGASAQYGADAVAGVINIVLDDAPQGSELGVHYGLHNSNVSPVSQRLTDGQTLALHGHTGMALGTEGYLRAGAEYARRSTTNRAGLDQVPPAFAIPQTPANLAFAGQRTHRVGDPASEEYKAWFNAAVPLGQFEAYAFGTFLARDTEGADVFRYPDSNQNVPEIFPDGFLPVTQGENRDVAVSGGLRTQLDNWAVDTSVSLGRNRFDFGVENSLNASLGPDSPTDFHAGRFTLTVLNAALELRREIDLPPISRPALLSAGLDLRHERFESQAGDEPSFIAGDFRFEPALEALVGLPDIGSQAAKGLGPEDTAQVRRDVAGAWIEVGLQPIEQLQMDVAGRIERYSDFGTAVAGKLSARYDISAQVALRGSASNSFRPPSPAQIGWSRRDNTFGPDAQRVSSRLIRADSAIAAALDIQPLREETSRNVSLGTVLRPTTDIDLALDVFRIDVDDRVTLSQNLQNPELIAFVQSVPGGQGVQSIATFTNAVDTRTEGAELTANHQRPVGTGELRLSLAYSYIRTRVRNETPPGAALLAFDPDLSLLGVAERNTLQETSPRQRLVLGANWQHPQWRVQGRLRHYTSVVREFTFARQRFGDEQVVDVEIARALGERTWLSLGADNLFDALPDPSNGANNFFGNFAFDPISPIGINGRFIWMRAVTRFQ